MREARQVGIERRPLQPDQWVPRTPAVPAPVRSAAKSEGERTPSYTVSAWPTGSVIRHDDPIGAVRLAEHIFSRPRLPPAYRNGD
jgi:hypothetical protein